MPNKPVVFAHHARLRMADTGRGVITEEEALAVLVNPEVSYTGVDGKSNVLGTVNGKRIRICYVEEENRILVITVVNRGQVG